MKLAGRPPLDLKPLQSNTFTGTELAALYARLAEMPWLLDDTLRDPYTFAQSIYTSPTFLMGDPVVGLIWFPNLMPGVAAAICGAVWARAGWGRTLEAKQAIAAVARVHKVHRFWSLTAAENRPARKFNLRIGMREEGLVREGLCYRGAWVNAILNGLLTKELR